MSKPRSLKQNEAGRIPKKVEFEPAIYKKAERLIKASTTDTDKPTLKTTLSKLVEAEHERRFGKAAA